MLPSPVEGGFFVQWTHYKNDYTYWARYHEESGAFADMLETPAAIRQGADGTWVGASRELHTVWRKQDDDSWTATEETYSQNEHPRSGASWRLEEVVESGGLVVGLFSDYGAGDVGVVSNLGTHVVPKDSLCPDGGAPLSATRRNMQLLPQGGDPPQVRLRAVCRTDQAFAVYDSVVVLDTGQVQLEEATDFDPLPEVFCEYAFGQPAVLDDELLVWVSVPEAGQMQVRAYRPVTAGQGGDKLLALDGGSDVPLAYGDASGRRVLLKETWEILDVETNQRIKMPKGPSTGDQDYIYAYAVAARGEDTVVAYMPSTVASVYLGVCGPDACPEELAVVPECVPDPQAEDYRFGAALAPDGSAAAVMLWTTATGFALYRVSPESGQCTLLWTGGPGDDMPNTDLFPRVSWDSRWVAVQTTAGLIVASFVDGTSEPFRIDTLMGNAIPVFSPDSRFVYTTTQTPAAAAVVDVESGDAMTVTEGGAWTP